MEKAGIVVSVETVAPLLDLKRVLKTQNYKVQIKTGLPKPSSESSPCDPGLWCSTKSNPYGCEGKVLGKVYQRNGATTATNNRWYSPESSVKGPTGHKSQQASRRGGSPWRAELGSGCTPLLGIHWR